MYKIVKLLNIFAEKNYFMLYRHTFLGVVSSLLEQSNIKMNYVHG